jgi:putative oxidoreductase
VACTHAADGSMRTMAVTSTQNVVITLLRVALGVVFVSVSIGKIADASAFAASISGYRIVTGDMALLAGTILPWVELLCGCGLIFGLFVRGSSFLVLIMVTVFTIAVISALWRGLDISCGCYRQDPGAARIGWWKVGENSVFILVSLLVFVRSDVGLSVMHLHAHRSSQSDE